MAMYPKCNRIDCFANKCGSRCDILTECIDTENCKFYKTDNELDNGRANAHKHLKLIHREDLIKRYKYNALRKW